MYRLLLVLIPLWITTPANSGEIHPLRLSLCELEYTSSERLLTINLKLFLTDVNEAIVFDPFSEELRFCQPNESPEANQLLLDYLNRFFYVKINGTRSELEIKRKKLSGEGENTALWVYFEVSHPPPLNSVEIKNAVFTDLFFDQNNIVYIHVDDKSTSLMLNKNTSVHTLTF